MITPEDVLHVVDSTDLPVTAAKLRVDAPFLTQGLDSLDIATLMVAVETRFQKVIPEDQLGRLRSVNDIVNFLNA